MGQEENCLNKLALHILLLIDLSPLSTHFQGEILSVWLNAYFKV